MSKHTINIERFIGQDKKNERKLINFLNKEKRILLVANPGTGKTQFSLELKEKQTKKKNRFIYTTFLTALPKQMHTDFGFDLFCSSSEKTWTDRISEADTDDDLLLDTELVVGTTLHQLTRFAKELSKDDIIVIDEAHQLVQLSHQSRIQVLRDELLQTRAKLLLMTGTPFLEDASRLNLTVVNVVEAEPRIDNLIYLPVTDKMKEESDIYDFVISLVHWYFNLEDGNDESGKIRLNADTKKILIYNNSSKDKNEILVNRLYESYDFRFDDINADKKETEGYQYLINHQKIRDEANGIVTTSVIKEGINIRNQDIDMIIVLGHLTLKDEKQIAKRIRGDKPINIFRVYEQVDKEKIEEIEFEIDLVKLISNTFKERPHRLKKQLKRLAECGDLLKSTGILERNVKKVILPKVDDILEQLDAQKASLKDYIDRQTYNDLEALDGYKYLEEEHKVFIADFTELGETKDQLKDDADELRKQKDEELRDLMLMLFGNSNHFDIVIKLLKGDLISYSKVGELLRDMDATTIHTITADDYITDHFPEEEYDDLDDEEKIELLFKTVKTFSTKYRKEMLATIKILYFLTEHADDITDVLRILNKRIPRNKLEWTARRLISAEKLAEIRKTAGKTTNPKSIFLLAKLPKAADRVALEVIKEIESHVEEYSVIRMKYLKNVINKKYGASQYMKALGIHTEEGLKLFVHAMGKIKLNKSWKISANNSKYFNKLWKDSGEKGLPATRSSLRIYELEVCDLTELVEHYRDDF